MRRQNDLYVGPPPHRPPRRWLLQILAYAFLGLLASRFWQEYTRVRERLARGERIQSPVEVTERIKRSHP